VWLSAFDFATVHTIQFVATRATHIKMRPKVRPLDHGLCFLIFGQRSRFLIFSQRSRFLNFGILKGFLK
jgi:hypothetical protein